MDGVPRRLTTDRLVLRCWEPADAPLLKAAIDVSLPELLPWMPWAHVHPTEVEGVERIIESFRAKFDAGEDFTIGLLSRDEAEALGSAGLHPRIGPGAVEIGYWIRSDVAGRGLATEAARELTRTAFEEVGVERVEIRCDTDNARSARIPRRLGFRLRETLTDDGAKPGGAPRGTLVFEMKRGEWEGR